MGPNTTSSGKWQTKTPGHQQASSGSTSHPESLEPSDPDVALEPNLGFGVFLKDILSSTDALIMNIKGDITSCYLSVKPSLHYTNPVRPLGVCHRRGG